MSTALPDAVAPEQTGGMARRHPLSTAHDLALQGRIEEAVAELEPLAVAGHGGASASLAEIAAFQGDWEVTLGHTGQALLQPDDLYSMNVYEGLCLLAFRAGEEREDWDAVRTLAIDAAAKLPIEDDESTEAWISTAESLGQAAEQRGVEPLLLPEIFQSEDKQAKFEQGVTGLQQPKMQKRYPSESARTNYLYALARALGYPQGAIEEWERSTELPSNYECAEFLAAGLVAEDRADEAWRVIEECVSTWWPVSLSQVAPIDLIVQPSLAPLMNSQRSEFVLRTPRGPMAQ